MPGKVLFIGAATAAAVFPDPAEQRVGQFHQNHPARAGQDRPRSASPAFALRAGPFGRRCASFPGNHHATPLRQIRSVAAPRARLLQMVGAGQHHDQHVHGGARCHDRQYGAAQDHGVVRHLRRYCAVDPHRLHARLRGHAAHARAGSRTGSATNGPMPRDSWCSRCFHFSAAFPGTRSRLSSCASARDWAAASCSPSAWRSSCGNSRPKSAAWPWGSGPSRPPRRCRSARMLGGYIADNFDWHLIFTINVPVGIICFFATWIIQREYKTQQVAPVRFRRLSVALGVPELPARCPCKRQCAVEHRRLDAPISCCSATPSRPSASWCSWSRNSTSNTRL